MREETKRRSDEATKWEPDPSFPQSPSQRDRWLVSLLFVAPLTLEAFALLLRYAFDCWLIQPWHLLLLPAFSVSAALTLGVLAFFTVARTSGTCSSIPDPNLLRQAGGTQRCS